MLIVIEARCYNERLPVITDYISKTGSVILITDI